MYLKDTYLYVTRKSHIGCQGPKQSKGAYYFENSRKLLNDDFKYLVLYDQVAIVIILSDLSVVWKNIVLGRFPKVLRLFLGEEGAFRLLLWETLSFQENLPL